MILSIKSEFLFIKIITKTITTNYTTYYACVVKDDAWIEWYQTQKHIFESVK